MLRDAMYCLLGMGSSAFFTQVGLQLPTGETALHPAEVKLCHRIIAIAQSYMTIKKFVNSVLKTSGKRSTSGSLAGSMIAENRTIVEPRRKRGLYMLAFCEGIETILEPYHQEIGALEVKAMKDPQGVSLTLVVSAAERYTELFQVLNSIIHQIEVQNIRGCGILNFLYPHQNSGVDNINQAFQCLIHKCQTVMINQLSKWLIYGYLEDAHNEFFIQNVKDAQSIAITTASTVKSLEQKLDSRKNQGLNWAAHYQFRIEPSMLPNDIKHSLASKILYIGRTVRVFGHDPDSLSRFGFESEEGSFSIWSGEEVEYFGKLQSFQKCNPGPMNIYWLQTIVEDLRGEVMKHMWQLIIEESKLCDEIKLMRDIFLIGRGELFHEMLDKTEGVRQETWNKTKDRDVQAAFVMAIHKILPNDETMSEKFKFCFELPVGSDEDVFLEKDGWWHFISLKYTVHWPLQLMFTPIILDNYNIIFRFLFRLKRALVNLHSIWHRHMKTKDKSSTRSRTPTFWLLQHNMLYMLNNIQYYLQVTVIEPLYKDLLAKVQQCSDIEAVIQAHMNFQANVMRQFFLMMRKVPEYSSEEPEDYSEPVPQANPIHKGMMSILQVSEKFSSIAKTWGDNLDDRDIVALDTVFQEFQLSVGCFLELLSSVQDHFAFLFQLCAKLDFNDQFSFKSNPNVPKETEDKTIEENV